MSCYMCSGVENLSPALFLAENISTAAILLKRSITEEDVRNAFACSSCAQTFQEYLELQQRLTNIENVFTNKSSSVPAVKNDLEPVLYNTEEPIDTSGLEFSSINDILQEEEEIDNPESGIIVQDLSYALLQDDGTIVYEEALIQTQTEIVNNDGPQEEEIAYEYVDGQIQEQDVEEEEIITSSEQVVSAKNVSGSPNEVLKCSHCPFETNSKSSKTNANYMVTHLQEIHYINVVICEVCGEEFINKEEYKEHKKVHMDISVTKLFPCTSCDLQFPSSVALSLHTKDQHPHNSQPPTAGHWECEYCKKKFSSRAMVEDHLNSHGGIRPHKCETCSADFASKYMYNRHLKIHTDRPREYKCTECGKSFTDQSNLTKHSKIHNPGEFPCQYCNKSFKGRNNLRQHTLTHNVHRPFACNQCDKTFYKRVELDNHERVHTGEKPFVCEICNAAFAQKANLRSHIKTTHLNEEKFKCNECPRTFKRQRLLDGHVFSVHKKERPYKCQLCDADYAYSDHLRKHVQSYHTDSNKAISAPCEICEKVFPSSEARSKHRYVHSERKLYECVVCEKGFMKKSQLFAHMRIMDHVADTMVMNSLSVQETGDAVGQKAVQLVRQSRIVLVKLGEEGDMEQTGEEDPETEGLEAPETQGSSSLEEWGKGDDMLYNSFLA